jgi:hypothetical protein
MNSAPRATEVIWITLGDVDLERGYFNITTSKRKQGDWMPITEDLAVELRRWFKEYEIDAGRPLEKTGYLFPKVSASIFDRYVTNLLTSKRILLRTERRVTPEIGIGIQADGRHRPPGTEVCGPADQTRGHPHRPASGGKGRCRLDAQQRRSGQRAA